MLPGEDAVSILETFKIQLGTVLSDLFHLTVL